jgi:hypothetical protein
MWPWTSHDQTPMPTSLGPAPRSTESAAELTARVLALEQQVEALQRSVLILGGELAARTAPPPPLRRKRTAADVVVLNRQTRLLQQLEAGALPQLQPLPSRAAPAADHQAPNNPSAPTDSSADSTPTGS